MKTLVKLTAICALALAATALAQPLLAPAAQAATDRMENSCASGEFAAATGSSRTWPLT